MAIFLLTLLLTVILGLDTVSKQKERDRETEKNLRKDVGLKWYKNFPKFLFTDLRKNKVVPV